MNILTIRTDKPESELALFDDTVKRDECIWEAHRQLADTILVRIRDLLTTNELDWHDIEGIVCYEGPGSFTGLRIGLTVGNTIASDRHIPIVAAGGSFWQQDGIARIISGKPDALALPNYGAAANITLQKK